METFSRFEPEESGVSARTGLLLEDWARTQTSASDRSATTPNAGAQQQEENFITRIQIPMTSLYHCERDCRFRSMSGSSDEPLTISARLWDPMAADRESDNCCSGLVQPGAAHDQNSELIKTSSPKAPLWVGS